MEVIDQPLAEPQQNSADLTQETQTAHHHTGKRWGNPFTKENSAEMARRAQAVRKQRELEEEAARAKSTDLKALSDADYRSKRLLRTREQMEQLDGELEEATDPKAIKALCDSIRALSEVERILAGRPLPGSNRPTKASTARPTAIEPSE